MDWELKKILETGGSVIPFPLTTEMIDYLNKILYEHTNYPNLKYTNPKSADTVLMKHTDEKSHKYRYLIFLTKIDFTEI